jgi:hypothetical protein
VGPWEDDRARISAASKEDGERRTRLAAQAGEQLEVPLIEALASMGLAVAQEAAPAGPTPMEVY